MDPEVTYKEMREAIEAGDMMEAREHALNLDRWLMRGGFNPDRKHLENVLRTEIRQILAETRHLQYTTEIEARRAD